MLKQKPRRHEGHKEEHTNYSRNMLKRTSYMVLIFALLAAAVSCRSARDVPAAEAVEEEPPQEESSALQDVPRVTAVEEPVDIGEAMASLDEEYRHRTNKALEHLVNAQVFVEEGMPGIALYEINLSIAILETADGLAVKGSILHLLGRADEAQRFWQKALELNPEAIHEHLPGIPEAFNR